MPKKCSRKNYFCKILKSKNGLLPTNFTKEKFFGLYLWPALEKACGTGTTCRREIQRGKEFLSFTPLTIQQAFLFSKIDKILLIQLLRSYFILVLDISYSQTSLQWEMPENKIIYLKLNKNYKLAVLVQGNPRNSGFEHHVALHVPVRIKEKTFCNQGNLTHNS